MAYAPRPGPSPVVAALWAAGVLHAGQRILDVGCGTGHDAVALARWGARAVVGIDLDRVALAAARRRASYARVLARAEFVEADVRKLSDTFHDGVFDAVVDTLLLNNLKAKDVGEYALEVHRVLRPGGILVLQERFRKWAHDRAGRDIAPPEALRALFEFGPTTATHLPEAPLLKRDPPFARVAVSVGRRR